MLTTLYHIWSVRDVSRLLPHGNGVPFEWDWKEKVWAQLES